MGTDQSGIKLEINVNVANVQLNTSGGDANMDNAFVYIIQKYPDADEWEIIRKEDDHDEDIIIRIKDWDHGGEVRALRRKDLDQVNKHWATYLTSDKTTLQR